MRSEKRVSYFRAHGAEIRATIEAGLEKGATSLDGLARALNARGVDSPESKQLCIRDATGKDQMDERP